MLTISCYSLKIRKECPDPACTRTYSDPSTLSRHVAKHHPELRQPKPMKKVKKDIFRKEKFSRLAGHLHNPPFLTRPMVSPLESATLDQPVTQSPTTSCHGTATSPLIRIVLDDFDTAMMPFGWGMAESTPADISAGQVPQEVFPTQPAIPCQPSWQSSIFSSQGSTGIVPRLNSLDTGMPWGFGKAESTPAIPADQYRQGALCTPGNAQADFLGQQTMYDVPYSISQSINYPGPSYMPPVSTDYASTIFRPDYLGYSHQSCRFETQAAFPYYGAFFMGPGVTV